jgi:putative Holliday junction resolvase
VAGDGAAGIEGAVLAFDFGLKHIGVATGQTITRTATALTTLAARDGKPDWVAVCELVTEWRPIRLIVGLPLNMDDSESEMSERARAFAARLGKETGLQVELADERLTSRAVADAEGDQAHAEAAALIAETWLNALI